MWAPFASHLTDRFRCLAVDYRGHGVAGTPEGTSFAWSGMGDDAVAVLDSGLIPPGVALHAAGHSMGGAALVLAAARRPGRFASLWLFEPIIPPPGALAGGSGRPNPMADAARRRRATFESLDAAVANYSAKPPLDELHPDALRDYVAGGFEVLADGSATLRCRPEWEAATFEGAAGNGAWEAVAGLEVPVAVVTGRPEAFGPASFAPAVASALPQGRLVEHPELGHFGPLQAPEAMAAELGAWIDAAGVDPAATPPA